MTEMSPEAHVPDAVTKVTRDLTAIVDLAAHLGAQAVHRSNDRLMPGGHSTVALAHVANLEAWEYRYEAAEENGYDVSHVEDEDDTWEPPLQTLLFWSEQWRREREAEYDLTPSVASEANFIRFTLAWAWDNEPQWDDFAADIRRARLRLEDELYAGRRAERSRVKCIEVTCERAPRLIKIHGQRVIDDRWKCPACKRLYDASDYARAKADLLSREDANRHVKYQDAREAIDRSERTFRKWLRYWYVRSYRDPLTGQVWVWWPDVRETDLNTPKRVRSVA